MSRSRTSSSASAAWRIAWATLRSGSCSPGIVAHPCLPIYSPRCHELSSFSATSFTALAGSRPDWTTQIGARRVTTASWAMVSAVCRAVPPVTQPPQLKPTIIVSTTEATQHQKATVLVGCASLHRCPTLRFLTSRPFVGSSPHDHDVGRTPARRAGMYPSMRRRQLGTCGKDRALRDNQACRADGRDEDHRHQARVGRGPRLWKIQLTTTPPIRPRMTSHPRP